MQTADQMLLERWRAEGDAEAFREITARYAGLVYAAAKRVLKDPSDAEDVAQECFEALALRREAAPTYLGAWLHTVATNRALNYLDTVQRRRAREQRAAAATPEFTRTEWDDLYEHVDAAIAELPEELHAAIVGHFLEGRSKADLARALGVSRPAIHYRIDKGLEHVRHALRRRGVTASTGAFGAAMAAQASEVVPASLIAGLGKIAVAGATTSVTSRPPVVTSAFSGSFGLKVVSVCTIIAAIAGGIGFTRQQNYPTSLEVPQPGIELAITNGGDAGPVAMPIAAVTPETPSDVAENANVAPAKSAQGDFSDAGIGDLIISGRILNRRGQPLERAQVQVSGQGASAMVFTGEDGVFRLTGLPTGIYSGSADHSDYTGQALRDLEAGSEGLDIVLDDLGNVEGTVVDARTGFPVPRYSVSWQRGFASAVQTGSLRDTINVDDTLGQFRIRRVSLGQNTLIIRADGYKTAFTPVTLESSEPLLGVRIEVSAGIRAEGRVLDTEGNVVPGARLYTQAWAQEMQFLPDANSMGARAAAATLAGVTGEDGTFSIGSLDGSEEAIYAFHSEKGSGKAALVWDKALSLQGLDITLERSIGEAELWVTIGGQPAEGSFAFAAPLYDPHGSTYQNGRTDANGRVHFSSLPSGELRIVAGIPGEEGYRRRITVNVTIEAGKTISVPIAFEAPSAALEGLVRLGEELPTGGGITLQMLRGEDEEVHIAAILTGGTFKIDNLAPGEATMNINPTFGEIGHWKSIPVTITEGTNPWMEIDFAGDGVIEGVIQGIPITAHAQVSAIRGGVEFTGASARAFEGLAGQVEGSVVADSAGGYRLEDIAPGQYTLLCFVTTTAHTIRFEDARFATAVVEVVDGETTTADFDMSE